MVRARASEIFPVSERQYIQASQSERNLKLDMTFLFYNALQSSSDVCRIYGTRDVNFREFYFSIREFQISRLVEYSKLTRHLAWTTHFMCECCNTLDITPRSCGLAAAPGKWSDRLEAVAVSNYKARLSLSCTSVLSDPTTDRPLSSQSHGTLWL